MALLCQERFYENDILSVADRSSPLHTGITQSDYFAGPLIVFLYWGENWSFHTSPWGQKKKEVSDTRFGIGIQDTKRPQFASGYILLALALEHGALFGIETAEDLAQYDLSNGQIPLHWNDEYLEKPVLRNVIAEGPQDTPLAKDAFGKCLEEMLAAAGYTTKPKVHEIRKHLGKKIEGGLPKPNQHRRIGRFYEPGLPGELPAEIEESILKKPEILKIRGRIEQLESQVTDKGSIQAEKRVYRKSLIRHHQLELKQHQLRWVRERRDRRILNKWKR
ncbi:hypothetical protein N7532_000708 [Penicillium argentinense]|uniref:Uncharacterized protein n=1 Tax=Penicillium argentinense TaxID=1131581 RepID=A0A9W9KP48_9EURO|nr:uncharacterized protein N7532_000708 [Penicillium argentinense]KAJ5112663.1 hypothetical protein N7532_000708 [Penicillium argentinense]